jgi:hypothetical protein
VRAIKVQILPDESPERGVVECIPLTSRVESESFLENWENLLSSGAEFSAVNPLFGYVDDSLTAINPDPQFPRTILGVDQHDLFYHLFGRTADCFNLDDEDLDNSGILDRDVSSRRHPRETFVFHVLVTTKRRLLRYVMKLEHMEAGFWTQPKTKVAKMHYPTLSQYGVAFATALILKTAPTATVKSLRLHCLPRSPDPLADGPDESLQPTLRFGLRQVAARLKSLGHHLTCLDLDINNDRRVPVGMTPNEHRTVALPKDFLGRHASNVAQSEESAPSRRPRAIRASGKAELGSEHAFQDDRDENCGDPPSFELGCYARDHDGDASRVFSRLQVLGHGTVGYEERGGGCLG